MNLKPAAIGGFFMIMSIPTRQNRSRSRASLWLTVIGLLLLFAIATSSPDQIDRAADSSSIDGDSIEISAPVDSLTIPMRMIISIDRMLVHDGRVFDTLAVSLESFGRAIAGFDIKIAVESPLVELVEILPGEIIDSCRWELFDARKMARAGSDGYPDQLWQVIGLAETVPRPDGARCFGFNRAASIAKLVLSSDPLALVPDTTVAVFFIWSDCGDNSVANASGDTLALSSQLYDLFPVSALDSGRVFPTRLGAPRQCIDPAAPNPPIRMIEFHNGGIEFRLEFEPDSSQNPVSVPNVADSAADTVSFVPQ